MIHRTLNIEGSRSQLDDLLSELENDNEFTVSGEGSRDKWTVIFREREDDEVGDEGEFPYAHVVEEEIG